MDETPVRGNWSAHMPRPQSKICLKKENTVSERDKYSSLKDCGKISLQRFRPSIASKKSKIAAAEPTSVYAVDEHASHLGTQFNGRTYNRPETHSPRADCARFMPRFRYLRVPAACAGALSAPRQGGSSSEEPSERERETPRQRGTVNPRCSAAATARRSRRTKRSARRQYRQVAGCRTSCVAFPKAT